MSTIGKVFVVLNLFLAGLFLGYASTALAASDDFKGKLETEQGLHTATKAELEGKVSTLTVQLNEAKDRADALSNERDQEKARADRADTDLADARSTIQTLTASTEGIKGNLSTIEGRLDDMESAKDAALEARIAAESERDSAFDERDDALAAQRDAEDTARQLESRIAELETNLVATSDSLSKTETKLTSLIRLTGVNPSTVLTPPAIEAAVVDVNMSLSPGLVALNVGSNQKVEKGFVFEIFSNDVYKGRVEVVDVGANVSSAIVRLSNGQTIHRGDRASTSL